VGRQWRFRQDDLDSFLKKQYGEEKHAA